MAPYYDHAGITIYHGDCRDVLPLLKDISLVVTSPPYNLGRPSGAYANMRHGYGSHSDDLEDLDYVSWQQDMLTLCWAALAEDGAIFYNHKPLIREGQALLPTRLIPQVAILRQIIVWNRRGGFNWSPHFFCPSHEWILLLAKPAFRLLSRGIHSLYDVWDIAIDTDQNGHPCAFPEALPATVFSATHPGTVLDPFMGSGTTLRAAKNAGRSAIGIEIDERYCEIAARRLAQDVLPFDVAV